MKAGLTAAGPVGISEGDQENEAKLKGQDCGLRAWLGRGGGGYWVEPGRLSPHSEPEPAL